jgi:peptide/nickel transport system permease protein
MTRYLAQRLGASLITALLASLLVFVIVRQVPGDVVAQMLGQTSDPIAEQAMSLSTGNTVAGSAPC